MMLDKVEAGDTIVLSHVSPSGAKYLTHLDVLGEPFPPPAWGILNGKQRFMFMANCRETMSVYMPYAIIEEVVEEVICAKD